MGLAQGFEFRERRAGRGKGPGRVADQFAIGVAGASVTLPEPLPSSFLGLSAPFAVPATVPRAAGSSRTRRTTWLAWLGRRAASPMPMRKVLLRLDGRISISRGSGVVSKSTLPSATAAWPSTAAWCTSESTPTCLQPLALRGRPSMTCMRHRGLLRSSSCGCSWETASSGRQRGRSGGVPPFAAGQLVLDDVIAQVRLCIDPQAGLARLRGIHHSRRRSAGVAGMRAA